MKKTPPPRMQSALTQPTAPPEPAAQAIDADGKLEKITIMLAPRHIVFLDSCILEARRKGVKIDRAKVVRALLEALENREISVNIRGVSLPL